MNIDIKKVKVSNRLRETNDEAVKQLAQSIYEIGLLHPITIDKKGNLIAGAHRLAAYKVLAERYPEDDRWSEIPYLEPELEKLNAADKRKIELEENLKRTQMTWQERALGLLEYHRLAQTSSARKGERWTEQQTADLFGVSKTHFNSLKRVAERLKRSKDDPMWQIENPTEAIRLLFEEQKAKTTKKLAELNKSYKQSSQPPSPTATSDSPVNGEASQSTSQPDSRSAIPLSTFVPDLPDLYYHGDCLDVIPTIAGEFDHIITDPPYAIDMDNFMHEESVKNVKEEHQVKPNLELLKDFFSVAYKAAKDYSFLCMWYDIEHHETLVKQATEAGWIVCRWPFIWCKTSPCVNRVAQYNITKATENCLIMRKTSKAVLANKQSKNYILAPRDEVSKEHPFGKPEKVWNYLIDAVSFEGQTILDPFAGCGSSLLPIFKKGRKPIGIEIKEDHIVNGLNWLERKLNGR